MSPGQKLAGLPNLRAIRLQAQGGGEAVPILTERERAELAGMAVQVNYAAGSPIYREDEPSDFVYLLEEGVVRMSRATLHGGRQVIAFMWPGDAFGLSENGRYVNTAETLTAVHAHRLPARRLERVLQEDAELSFHLLVKGAHEMRAAQRHVLCLGQHDAVQRLARFLLDCRWETSCFDEASATLALPMNRTDIADYLGTSIETIARALTRLERGKLILRKGSKTLQVLSAAGLEEIASGGNLTARV